MNEKTILKLLSRSEGPSIDFKSKMYDLNHTNQEVAKRQYGEMIKDILSLANGNASSAEDDGYLVIGAGDALNADGTRDLFNIQDPLPNKKELILKVSAYCHPPLEDIDCTDFCLQGKRLIIITIPPSPYLYETRKDLVAGNEKN